MAAHRHAMLLLGDDRLAVASVERGAVDVSEAIPCARHDAATAIELACRLLEERKHGGDPVCLALGSSWCVSAALTIPTPRHAKKREAMGFLLEPCIPWSREDVVFDYELAGNRAFMVAAEAAPLAELIDGLEQRGIRVASISPLARLALRQHLQSVSATSERYVLLWGQGKTVDLWLIENDRPMAWGWVSSELNALARAVTQLALCEAGTLSVAVRNLSVELLEDVLAKTGLCSLAVAPLDSEEPLSAGAKTAAAVLEGRCESPIELRRDGLATKDRHRSIRNSIRFVQASAMLLMAAVGMALFVQARQHDRQREACEERQSSDFRRLYPGQPVPVAICSRLQSELARLKGVRGTRSDLPQTVPYLVVLERLLKAIPPDLRFRLLEVRIENGQLYLVGQVRGHGDADRIADGLRQTGLQVPAPNTHRLEREGVEFRISARLSEPDGKKPARKST